MTGGYDWWLVMTGGINKVAFSIVSNLFLFMFLWKMHQLICCFFSCVVRSNEMRNLILGAAAMLLSSGAANAASHTWDFGVNDNYAETYKAGSVVNDTYSFIIPSSGDLSGAYVSIKNNLPAFNSKSNLTFSINGDSYKGSVFGDTLTLAAGTYSGKLTGKIAAGETGVFAGSFVSAVPETAQFALLLAGLAAVGFVASRRRSSAPSVMA
jgi:hypothetical protein